MAIAPDGMSAPLSVDATRPAPPDTDPEYDRAQIYFAECCQELNEVTGEVDQLLLDLIYGVSNELNGAEANLQSLCDELVGAASLQLDEGATLLGRVVNALQKDVAKTLGNSIDELGMVGFTLPYLTSTMAQQVEGDFLTLVAQASPQLAPYLGVTTPPPQEQPPVSGGSQYGPVGNVPPGGGDFTLNLPPPPPADAAGYTGPFSVLQAQQPTLEGTQGTGAGQCCPAPVNVTVNVPPIVIPAAAQPNITLAPVVEPGQQGGIVLNPPLELQRSGLLEQDPISGQWRWRRYDPNQTPPLPAPPPAAPPPPPGPVTSFGGAIPSPLLFSSSTALPKVEGPDGIHWNDLGACARAEQVVKRPLETPVPPPAPGGERALDTWMQNQLPIGAGAMRWFTRKGEELWGKQPYDWMRDRWDQVMSWKNEQLTAAADATTAKLASGLASPTSTTNPTAALYYAGRLGLANLAERKTGVPLSYLYTSDLYLYQYSNPQYLPNQIRVDGAFLAGQIDENAWLCWTRANGNLPEPSRRIMLADQAKPNLMELILLYRRGHLKLEDLPKRARELGVIEPAYIPEWLAITKQLPTMTDLVRFMVRDSADDTVAKKYDYDKDFEKKYTPQIRAWAQGLGLDDTFFRYEWRSHWVVPSDTRLEEMFHRLRPDRPEVLAWDALAEASGEQEAIHQLGPRPQVVTIDDVREALEINDVAPRWVDPQIAIGYTPINRTDAVRAYQIGAFDEKRLYHAFRDVGYSDADAQTLVRYHAQDKARKRANVTGTWSMRKIVRYYKGSYLTRDQAAELMRPLTASAQEVERTLFAAEQEVAAETRAEAIKGTRRGFMSGEYSVEQARAMLAKFGADKGISENLITRWAIERDSRFKKLSATQAVKMLQLGLIGAEELRRRLRNLGYTIRDADLILAKALAIEGAADGLEPKELDEEITAAIRSRKEAAKLSDSLLMGRLSKIIKEAIRITSEVNERRTKRGEDPINPFQFEP